MGIRDLVRKFVGVDGPADLVPVRSSPRFYVLPKGNLPRVVDKGWEELRETSQTSIISNANPGHLAPTVTTVQALYKYRSWVYSCVDRISKRVANVPFFLYEEVGQPNDEEYDKILVHPLLQLLKRPNKFFSGREFLKVTQQHLDLTGMAFWQILRNGAGQPGELHIMNPHELVNIECGSTTDRLIEKFIFASPQQRQQRVEIKYDDIVYFRYAHPANPLLPCTPIQAAAHATDIDLFLQVYEKDFFQNNARPDYVIVAEDDIGEPEARRVQEEMLSRHRGPGKQYRPAVLSGGVKIEQLSMSAHDFEFMALAEWVKDNVLATYGVPEAMLGLFESFNKASSITAETVFVKESIDPRLRLIEDAINLQLKAQFRGTDQLEFKFDSALPKDDEWNLTKNQAELTMGLISVNEIRKKEGKKAYDCKLLDVPWINGSPVPGVDDEADKIWTDNMMKMSGGAMAAPSGAPPPMGAEGIPPEMAAMMGQPPMGAPLPASNAPVMQGSFGATGGRPEGTALNTLFQNALRTSRPGLSTLLNAARGSRGGLSQLMSDHPELHSASELLNKNRGDQVLARLMQKSIYEYIENDLLSDDDRLVFKTYEQFLPEWDVIEEEYKEPAMTFLVEKGAQLAGIVEKALDNFVTKESFEDIDEQALREEYKESIKEYAEKAVDLGLRMGIELVEKAVGEEVNIAPGEISREAVGRFLERSADLKVDSVKKQLMDAIREGIDEGLDSEGVAKLISTKFADIPPHRAQMIARTELAGAVDIGLDASYEKINKDSGKTLVKKASLWTALDERVCEECEPLHGRVVKNYKTGKDDYYYVFKGKRKLLEIPVHPQCRCVRKPETGD